MSFIKSTRSVLLIVFVALALAFLRGICHSADGPSSASAPAAKADSDALIKAENDLAEIDAKMKEVEDNLAAAAPELLPLLREYLRLYGEKREKELIAAEKAVGEGLEKETVSNGKQTLSFDRDQWTRQVVTFRSLTIIEYLKNEDIAPYVSTLFTKKGGEHIFRDPEILSSLSQLPYETSHQTVMDILLPDMSEIEDKLLEKINSFNLPPEEFDQLSFDAKWAVIARVYGKLFFSSERGPYARLAPNLHWIEEQFQCRRRLDRLQHSVALSPQAQQEIEKLRKEQAGLIAKIADYHYPAEYVAVKNELDAVKLAEKNSDFSRAYAFLEKATPQQIKTRQKYMSYATLYAMREYAKDPKWNYVTQDFPYGDLARVSEYLGALLSSDSSREDFIAAVDQINPEEKMHTIEASGDIPDFVAEHSMKTGASAAADTFFGPYVEKYIPADLVEMKKSVNEIQDKINYVHSH